MNIFEKMKQALTAMNRARSTPIVDNDFPELIHNADKLMLESLNDLKINKTPLFDFHAFLIRQNEFSINTFGSGLRTKGIIDHIKKEFAEIEAQPTDYKEWIDVILLTIDGACRTGTDPRNIITALQSKLEINESRNWPDWRNLSEDVAIEHIK